MAQKLLYIQYIIKNETQNQLFRALKTVQKGDTMKTLYAFGIFLFALNIWAQEETQTSYLSTSGTPQFYATDDLESGTFILIRDHKTAEDKNIKIRRHTGRSRSIQPGGALGFVMQAPRFNVAVMQEYIVNLDFSKLGTLEEGETEEIVLELDFSKDKVKVKSAAIMVDDSDRENTKIKRQSILVPAGADLRYKFKAVED